jgi:hypothetical protein
LRRETIFEAMGVPDHTDHGPPHRLISTFTVSSSKNFPYWIKSGDDHAPEPPPDQYPASQGGACLPCYFRAWPAFGPIAQAAPASGRHPGLIPWRFDETVPREQA